ncbi:hypothetical protein COLO4_26198 [Corchorus olitorius]|uniref:Uncharacterized protein n=1 Tax=Corchorus olitorius TaxID=93759 RepID=A0A1R3HY66_9ROSI|nr:hypothetical protein COLO4_26198 [Corchorus olitorius]
MGCRFLRKMQILEMGGLVSRLLHSPLEHLLIVSMAFLLYIKIIA